MMAVEFFVRSKQLRHEYEGLRNIKYEGTR